LYQFDALEIAIVGQNLETFSFSIVYRNIREVCEENVKYVRSMGQFRCEKSSLVLRFLPDLRFNEDGLNGYQNLA